MSVFEIMLVFCRMVCWGFLLLVIFRLAFLACCERAQVSGGAAVLNLLLLRVEDLLTETFSWKLAPSETLWVGVTGVPRLHKTAAPTVAELERRGNPG